ncbi:MAG: coproporphyrinogen-III oxidase family protein [Chloroflexota bacterium]|nr:coproporphyrinogen-III oxidase family protein [Chloroflexota bacterium]
MILSRHSFGIWGLIAKRTARAVFTLPDPSLARKAIKETLAGTNELGVYIHIPFCKSLCLFCPYVRFLVRDAESISQYVEALKAETRMYGELLQGLGLKIVHIHVGGGTPSLLDGSHFREILNTLAQYFETPPRIAIEANPDDLVNERKVCELINCGVADVSLGVQSSNPNMLKKLGRKHSWETSLQAITNLRRAGVEHLNMDLMFMVPGQSLEEWVQDLESATRQDVDEITVYPTLITEHCLGYKLVEKGQINQPDRSAFKKMVYTAEDTLSSKGFKPVEIYSYSKQVDWKYATVNYEMEGPLLGIGCGAIGFTGGYEYQNTCSVQEYIRAVLNKRLPIAGARPVSANRRAIRYAACRLFICRRLNRAEFEQNVGSLSLLGSFGKMLTLFRLLGYIKEENGELKLTRKGLFPAHLRCWASVTNWPCRMAQEFLKTPWPTEVKIP